MLDRPNLETSTSPRHEKRTSSEPVAKELDNDPNSKANFQNGLTVDVGTGADHLARATLVADTKIVT